MGSIFFSKRYPETVKRTRGVRPKTFKSEDSAKAYAEKNGIKKYDIVNLKNEECKIKKLKVVPN